MLKVVLENCKKCSGAFHRETYFTCFQKLVSNALFKITSNNRLICLSSVSIIFSIDFGFSGKSSSLFSDHEIYVFMKVSLKKELKEISNDQVFPIKKIFKVLLPIVEISLIVVNDHCYYFLDY